MRTARIAFIILAATLIAVGASTTSYAFHSGGVAECEGCHSMHSPVGANFLLVGSDQSSTCLTCHEGLRDRDSSYHIATPGTTFDTVPPETRTPGGDFAWLKKTFSYTGGSEAGDTHGHNIVAADFGYNADATNSTAPGGTFSSASLACNSCHDPHGQYRRLSTGVIAKTGQPTKASGSYNGAGNEPVAPGASNSGAVGVYRLLAGAGYSKAPFSGVPAAKAPSNYNVGEATAQVRVAYGNSTASGHASWGSWCAACHPDMHTTGGNNVHPIDQNLGSTIAGIYNTYVKSGDMGGSSATSYNSLVPFVQNSGVYTDLATAVTSTEGPSGGTAAQVSCVSCHRAHASGWLHALRWDPGYEFITKAGAYVSTTNPEVTGGRAPLQHRGRTDAFATAAYYDRPATAFATYQRSLCNKCHGWD